MSGLFEHGYPYTDSHEINLSWVILKVKELAEAWAQVQQDWTDEQAAFANLQSWIENYFNNLNVQTEINVKLDAMVEAGTMSELIAPYVASGLPAEVAAQIGDVVAAQIGPVVAAQIGAVVADQLPAIAASAAATEVGTWLSTHIDPDTGYVIDDSLTVQGAAADAKAVGDEVTAIKSALSETNLLPTVYQYTASSGYQNVPCTLAAGTYLASNSTSSAVTFRDAENNTISGISIQGSANKQTLTVTVELASQVAYIRLYQQTVQIWKSPDIVSRVTTLESVVSNKADKSEIIWKADAEAEYAYEEITLENGAISINGNIQTVSDAWKHAILTVEANEKYSVSGLHINNNYPVIAIFDGNGNLLDRPYESSDSGAVEDLEFSIPSDGVTMYCNFSIAGTYGVKKGSPMSVEESCTAVEESANALTNFYERCKRKAFYQFSKYQNEFAWGTLPKGFISWMNDDCRDDLYLYKDLCDTYNIPYGNAVPYGTSFAMRTIDGTPLVTYLKGIVSDGGEIFSHAGSPLTSESTEEDFYNQFVTSKRTLESIIESDVDGIIMAGGSGYSTVDYDKCQEFSLSYYKYSDYYGTSPQYTIGRTRLLRSSYSSDEEQIQAFKDLIDDAVQNHKWLRLWCHGTDEVSITVLTAVFEYAKTYMDLGTLQAVTWKYMYDTYGNT